MRHGGRTDLTEALAREYVNLQCELLAMAVHLIHVEQKVVSLELANQTFSDAARTDFNVLVRSGNLVPRGALVHKCCLRLSLDKRQVETLLNVKETELLMKQLPCIGLSSIVETRFVIKSDR